MIGIYKFTNKYNRKVYVGQSTNIEKRRKFHKYYVYTRNSPFYLDVRKYGFEGFDFDVLIECPKENLNYWEEFYIKYYSSNNSNFGYNISKGGRGARGVTWSREVIDKRANKMKEKWSDEGYYNMMKVKMSVPHPKAKGRDVWNKGLNKEKDERILDLSIKIKDEQKRNPWHHMTNGEEDRRVNVEDVEYYKSIGYKIGRSKI